MNTGGPAFPLHTHDWHKEVSDTWYIDHDFTMGMTLRDYFAAKAMQALAQGNYFDATARQAYMIADAMLREREK